MSPSELFDPAAPFHPSRFVGPAAAAELVAAAQRFPGGPVMLVLALFFVPIGAGIPVGVLLARHVPLHPLVTFGLYVVSDMGAALVCHPIFAWLRRRARAVPRLRRAGQRVLGVAMLGIPRDDVGSWPALSRIATVGFGVDVYTAGLLATGLAVPRIPGWASAIAGDCVWFAVILTTSLAAGSVTDDDRLVLLAMVVAMIVVTRVSRRFLPQQPRAR
jgi:hypothetical protein